MENSHKHATLCALILFIQTSAFYKSFTYLSKTVKATDFKYDVHVSMDSLDMAP